MKPAFTAEYTWESAIANGLLPAIVKMHGKDHTAILQSMISYHQRDDKKYFHHKYNLMMNDKDGKQIGYIGFENLYQNFNDTKNKTSQQDVHFFVNAAGGIFRKVKHVMVSYKEDNSRKIMFYE